MSMFQIPDLSLTIGGEAHVVKVSQADLVRLERLQGKPMSEITFGVETVMQLGHLAARRLGLNVPADFEEFIDAVEVVPDTGSDNPKG